MTTTSTEDGVPDQPGTRTGCTIAVITYRGNELVMESAFRLLDTALGLVADSPGESAPFRLAQTIVSSMLGTTVGRYDISELTVERTTVASEEPG